MDLKWAGYYGKPEASKRLWCPNSNEDHVKMDFDPTIGPNDNGWKYDGFGKEMEESIERTPTNLKRNMGLDYLMHLRGWKVVMLEWHSNSKCLSSWITCMKNSKLARKWGPIRQNGEVVIMQGARPFYWRKKLANVVAHLSIRDAGNTLGTRGIPEWHPGLVAPMVRMPKWS
jgi:hypothetical protein